MYIDGLEETAKIISGEADKLEHKIKQLIYFNSLDYIMENEKINNKTRINVLFADLHDRLKLIRNDIKWELFLQEEIVISCSKDKLTIAFENILDNQIRYAESKISIKANKTDDKAVIEIYNDGPKIIEFHKGTIRAVNREKGVSFIIELPLK